MCIKRQVAACADEVPELRATYRVPEADKRSRETVQNLTAAPWARRQRSANAGTPEPQVVPRAA
eukprot:4034526-Alexandrium_andersonii.AAC.1